MSIEAQAQDAEFRDHPLWESTSDILGRLSSIEHDESEAHSVDRIRGVFGYLSGLRECPSPVVTERFLTEIQDAVKTFETGGFASWESGRAPSYLQQAMSPLETVATLTRQFPTTKDNFSYGVHAAFSAARDSSEAALKRLMAKVENAEVRLAQLEDGSQTAAEHARTDLDVLKDEINDATAQIAAQAGRLDTALTAHQTAFTTAESERAAEFQAARKHLDTSVSNALEAIKLAASAAEKGRTDQATAEIESLKVLDTQARNLVEAIGITGTATDYGKYAKQEREAANRWRWGAVTLFLLAFALFLVVLIVQHIDGQTPWQTIAVKFGGSLALLAGGTYAARESTQHREEERASKDTELVLNALEPFIANLENVEDKERLRRQTARRVFVEGRSGRLAKASHNKASDGGGNPADGV